MNENIDLIQILKDCPKGTKLYSPLFGEVRLQEIHLNNDYPIGVTLSSNNEESFTKDGKLYNKDNYIDTEYVLFPSKEQRDWSKFKFEKTKFNPNTLKPFDKVLARNSKEQIWHADLFSHIEEDTEGTYFMVIKNDDYIMIIPYNEETKHLVGTSDEAPEYYRCWED